MFDNFKIYIVDDEPIVLDSIQAILNPYAHIVSFATAESCLDYMTHTPPDLVLLDIELPGLNGYELCDYMKSTSELQAIPVIFVSSHDSIDERIKGYDVGGEDFIVKPFNRDELLKKVISSQKRILDRRMLVQNLMDSEQLSSLIISSIDETAILLQFMSKLIGIHDLNEIAISVLELLERYKLNGVIQIKNIGCTHTVSRAGVDIPIEVAVIEHVRKQGRIFEFHKRCVHNFDSVTLMINNLPVEDPDYVGRLRDHLSVAAQGVNSRVEAIITESLNVRAQAGIQRVLDKITLSITALNTLHQKNTKDSTEHLMTLQETLLNSFFKLGLSETQERFLQNMIGDFSERMMRLFDDNQEIHLILEDLTQELMKLKN